MCQQSDIVPFIFLVLLIPVAICHRYQQHQRYRWQNFPPVSLIPVAKLSACVLDTGGNFAIGEVDTGCALSLANIYANFQNNLR
jgi:hypothetical protein